MCEVHESEWAGCISGQEYPFCWSLHPVNGPIRILLSVVLLVVSELLYALVVIPVIFIAGCCATYVCKRRANDSDSSSGTGGGATSSNPLRHKRAKSLLEALARCVAAATAAQPPPSSATDVLGALNAFNAAPWTASDQEALSGKYCLTALAALRLFAAAHPSHPAGGVQAAAQALWFLSGTTAARAALAPTDALFLLVQQLAGPVANDTAVVLCEAISRLAVDDDVEQATVGLGVHALAVKQLTTLLCLPRDPSALKAMGAWVGLLASVTYDRGCQQAAAAAGAAQAVMAVFSTPLARDEQTALNLALCVAHVAQASDAAESEFVARGALAACTAILREPQISGEELVAASALQALLACVETPEHCLAAIECGALAAALAQLSVTSGRGKSSPRVLASACRFLGALSRSPAALAALKADNMRAVRAVAEAGHATSNAPLIEAVTEARERFKKAGLTLQG